jgi:hypothetical protein
MPRRPRSRPKLPLPLPALQLPPVPPPPLRISTSSWSLEKARSTLFLALYSCHLLYEKTPTIKTPPAPNKVI